MSDYPLEHKGQGDFGAGLHSPGRSARAFRSKREERRYWILLISLFLLAALAAFGLLVYNNPVRPPLSRWSDGAWWPWWPC